MIQVPVDIDKPNTAYKWHDDLWTSLLKASESLFVNVAGPIMDDLHKGDFYIIISSSSSSIIIIIHNHHKYYHHRYIHSIDHHHRIMKEEDEEEL